MTRFRLLALVAVLLSLGLVGPAHAVTTYTTDEDLVGPLAGMTLEDLVALIESGDAYVNVHTVANPGGEIRGQVG